MKRIIAVTILIILMVNCRPSRVSERSDIRENQQNQIRRLKDSIRAIQKRDSINFSQEEKSNFGFIVIPGKRDTITRTVKVRDRTGQEIITDINPSDSIIFSSSLKMRSKLNRLRTERNMSRVKNDSLAKEIKDIREKSNREEENRQPLWQRIMLGLGIMFLGFIFGKLK